MNGMSCCKIHGILTVNGMSMPIISFHQSAGVCGILSKSIGRPCVAVFVVVLMFLLSIASCLLFPFPPYQQLL